MRQCAKLKAFSSRYYSILVLSYTRGWRSWRSPLRHYTPKRGLPWNSPRTVAIVVMLVTGLFVTGQFVTDNSLPDNSLPGQFVTRTIRDRTFRDQDNSLPGQFVTRTFCDRTFCDHFFYLSTRVCLFEPSCFEWNKEKEREGEGDSPYKPTLKIALWNVHARTLAGF